MYLNNYTIQTLHELNENIFSFKVWTKKHQDQLKQTIDFLKKEADKVLEEGKKEYCKNYKEACKSLKEKDLKCVYIVKSPNDLKSLFKKLNDSFPHDPVWSDSMIINQASAFYDYFNSSPVTVNVVVRDKTDEKKKNPKLEISLIFIPEVGFFDRFKSGKTMTKTFDHRLWIEVDRALSLFHECTEFAEFARKRFHGGQIYIKDYNKNLLLVGNHHSVYVLAYEAIMLNKFKNLQAVQYLRDYRKQFEWKIIKDNTGVDLSKITEITPDVIKKLDTLKNIKLKDDYIMYSDLGTIQHMNKTKKDNFKTVKKLSEKLLKNIKIIGSV